MTSPVRVVIADDHALFRQGLVSMMSALSHVAVVAQVDRAAELVATLERHPCDVLLLDLEMERRTLADIDRLIAYAAVLVVTASEAADDAVVALRAGARGFVPKRLAVETLLAAIAAVVKGHIWLPPLLEAEVRRRLDAPPANGLTRRERDVAAYVARGLRNADIGHQLGISEVTVKTHLNNIFHKLRLRDRAELARYAAHAGIAVPDGHRV
jgi:two-component system NarL family response regulator